MKWKLKKKSLRAFGINLIKFVAPTLGVFFALLAQGVPVEKAWIVAGLGFYQALSDYFKKLK